MGDNILNFHSSISRYIFVSIDNKSFFCINLARGAYGNGIKMIVFCNLFQHSRDYMGSPQVAFCCILLEVMYIPLFIAYTHLGIGTANIYGYNSHSHLPSLAFY
ncbi:hypothetical protein D3C76_1653940 [compost metagenome]